MGAAAGRGRMRNRRSSWDDDSIEPLRAMAGSGSRAMRRRANCARRCSHGEITDSIASACGNARECQTSIESIAQSRPARTDDAVVDRCGGFRNSGAAVQKPSADQHPGNAQQDLPSDRWQVVVKLPAPHNESMRWSIGSPRGRGRRAARASTATGRTAGSRCQSDGFHRRSFQRRRHGLTAARCR